MRDVYLGLLDQPLDVVDDVVERKPGDVALAFELRRRRLAPLAARRLGEVRLVAQEVVDDEDADAPYPLLERLVRAVGTLAVREGKRVELLLGRVLGRLCSHLEKVLKTPSSVL